MNVCLSDIPPPSSRQGDCVALSKSRVVIPNECEGSKISPCGRNDREADGHDVFAIATQIQAGKRVGTQSTLRSAGTPTVTNSA
jgi:hypothetical protein